MATGTKRRERRERICVSLETLDDRHRAATKRAYRLDPRLGPSNIIDRWYWIMWLAGDSNAPDGR